ncbi:MAG: hypothetical protein ACTSPY_16490 [Candidatus Helarchaeota archaeon]
MFIDRYMKAKEIMKYINLKNFKKAEQLINELYESHELDELDPNTILNISALFDFPIDKEIEICIHKDSIILIYETPYFYEGKPIKGNRMFFFWDFESMNILPELLTYLKCRPKKCPDCLKES